MIFLHRLDRVAGFFQRGDAERGGLRAEERRNDRPAPICLARRHQAHDGLRLQNLFKSVDENRQRNLQGMADFTQFHDIQTPFAVFIF